MPSRIHVHLSVADLNASRAFYEKFFGTLPVKEKSDLVKFAPDFAPINLVLSPLRREVSSGRTVNHLGIEIASNDAVVDHLSRVTAAGIKARSQLNVTCCYANQSKFWVVDPDGVEWEIYHVNFDTVEKHGGGAEARRPDPEARATE